VSVSENIIALGRIRNDRYDNALRLVIVQLAASLRGKMPLNRSHPAHTQLKRQ